MSKQIAGNEVISNRESVSDEDMNSYEGREFLGDLASDDSILDDSNADSDASNSSVDNSEENQDLTSSEDDDDGRGGSEDISDSESDGFLVDSDDEKEKNKNSGGNTAAAATAAEKSASNSKKNRRSSVTPKDTSGKRKSASKSTTKSTGKNTKNQEKSIANSNQKSLQSSTAGHKNQKRNTNASVNKLSTPLLSNIDGKDLHDNSFDSDELAKYIDGMDDISISGMDDLDDFDDLDNNPIISNNNVNDEFDNLFELDGLDDVDFDAIGNEDTTANGGGKEGETSFLEDFLFSGNEEKQPAAAATGAPAVPLPNSTFNHFFKKCSRMHQQSADLWVYSKREVEMGTLFKPIRGQIGYYELNVDAVENFDENEAFVADVVDVNIGSLIDPQGDISMGGFVGGSSRAFGAFGLFGPGQLGETAGNSNRSITSNRTDPGCGYGQHSHAASNQNVTTTNMLNTAKNAKNIFSSNSYSSSKMMNGSSSGIFQNSGAATPAFSSDTAAGGQTATALGSSSTVNSAYHPGAFAPFPGFANVIPPGCATPTKSSRAGGARSIGMMSPGGMSPGGFGGMSPGSVTPGLMDAMVHRLGVKNYKKEKNQDFSTRTQDQHQGHQGHQAHQGQNISGMDKAETKAKKVDGGRGMDNLINRWEGALMNEKKLKSMVDDWGGTPGAGGAGRGIGGPGRGGFEKNHLLEKKAAAAKGKNEKVGGKKKTTDTYDIDDGFIEADEMSPRAKMAQLDEYKSSTRIDPGLFDEVEEDYDRNLVPAKAQIAKAGPSRRPGKKALRQGSLFKYNKNGRAMVDSSSGTLGASQTNPADNVGNDLHDDAELGGKNPILDVFENATDTTNTLMNAISRKDKSTAIAIEMDSVAVKIRELLQDENHRKHVGKTTLSMNSRRIFPSAIPTRLQDPTTTLKRRVRVEHYSLEPALHRLQDLEHEIERFAHPLHQYQKMLEFYMIKHDRIIDNTKKTFELNLQSYGSMSLEQKKYYRKNVLESKLQEALEQAGLKVLQSPELKKTLFENSKSHIGQKSSSSNSADAAKFAAIRTASEETSVAQKILVEENGTIQYLLGGFC